MTVQRLATPDWLPTSQMSGTSQPANAYSAEGSPTIDLPYVPGTVTKDVADVPQGPAYRPLVGDVPDGQGGWVTAKSGTWAK